MNKIDPDVLATLNIFSKYDPVGTKQRIGSTTYLKTASGWVHAELNAEKKKPSILADLVGFSAQKPGSSLTIGTVEDGERARVVFALGLFEFVDFKNGKTCRPPEVAVYKRGIALHFTGSPVTSTMLGSLGETTYRLSDDELLEQIRSTHHYRIIPQ
jgi:hypothetical protein